MALYEVTSENLTKIGRTSFDQIGLRERTDLQRLLQKQVDVILPDTLVITEEFGEWEDSKRRIDLLAIDKDANLVVIELKRTEDGGHMELQALRYAAMVSTMTFEKIVDVHSRYLTKIGSAENAQDLILKFLDWDEPDEDLFAQDVKIVLVSANFSKELTTTVIWLNQRDFDIRCIRVIPYNDNNRILIDVQQLIPLPEAAEYQIQIKEKEQKIRKERSENNTSNFRFWEHFLKLAKEQSSRYESFSPTQRDGFCLKSSRGLRFNFVANHYDSRVELYIDKPSAELNKSAYDQIFDHKEDIEKAFGGSLSWERLDQKVASRICYRFQSGVKTDESNWTELQTSMIEAMNRLEQSLTPYLDFK